MARKPTHEDAELVARLAEMAFQPQMVKAFDWIFGDAPPGDYEAFTASNPPGSEKHAHFLALAGFHETVGTLWKHRLINEELLFDWLAAAPAWDRVKALALGQRKQLGIEAIWENFEAMAEAQAKRTNQGATAQSHEGTRDRQQADPNEDSQVAW